MKKDFKPWFELKSWIDDRIHRPYFYEGEIWWASLGTNVGVEIDGKNEDVERPVFILKKFNNQSFCAIPMTSKEKDNPYHYIYSFEDTKFTLVLSQIRLLDARRLRRRITVLPKEER